MCTAGQRVLLIITVQGHLFSYLNQRRAVDPKETMSYRTQRVISICLSVRPSCSVKRCKASLRSSQAFPGILGLLITMAKKKTNRILYFLFCMIFQLEMDEISKSIRPLKSPRKSLQYGMLLDSLLRHKKEMNTT